MYFLLASPSKAAHHSPKILVIRLFSRCGYFCLTTLRCRLQNIRNAFIGRFCDRDAVEGSCGGDAAIAGIVVANEGEDVTVLVVVEVEGSEQVDEHGREMRDEANEDVVDEEVGNGWGTDDVDEEDNKVILDVEIGKDEDVDTKVGGVCGGGLV